MAMAPHTPLLLNLPANAPGSIGQDRSRLPLAPWPKTCRHDGPPSRAWLQDSARSLSPISSAYSLQQFPCKFFIPQMLSPLPSPPHPRPCLHPCPHPNTCRCAGPPSSVWLQNGAGPPCSCFLLTLIPTPCLHHRHDRFSDARSPTPQLKPATPPTLLAEPPLNNTQKRWTPLPRLASRWCTPVATCSPTCQLLPGRAWRKLPGTRRPRPHPHPPGATTTPTSPPRPFHPLPEALSSRVPCCLH